MPAQRFKSDPNNARIHNEANVEIIKRSIGQSGFGRSILVAKDGTILAGNATYDAATQVGLDDAIVVDSDGSKVVVVRRTDLDPTDPKAVELALADNRANELSTWNVEKIEQTRLEMPGMIESMWSRADLDALLGPVVAAKSVKEPEQVPLPDPPVTKPGDVWQLGRHYLVCGDARDVNNYIFAERPFDLLWTDPPYNADVIGGVHDHRSPAHRAAGREDKKLANDKMTDLGYEEFLDGCWQAFGTTLRPGAIYYVCCGSGHEQTILRNVMTRHGFRVRQSICWVKQHFSLGHLDYQWKHETLLYGWTPGGPMERIPNGPMAAHYFCGDYTQTTVWEIDRPTQTADMSHPTRKPVELTARSIANSTKPDDWVLDPFVGGGATVLGCEHLGRRCYALDVDPRYVDLTVASWSEMTGQPAVRIRYGVQ